MTPDPVGPETAPAPAAEPTATRRGVIVGVGLAGLAVPLAACGGGDSGGDTSGAASQPAGGAPSGSAGDGGGVLAKTSEIPVGGGKIFKDQKVVVTQPTQGQFAAFSAICTHRGCTVDAISGGTINCPCHGSMFKISDGSVAGGPAPKPLPRKKITVANGEIKLA